MPPAGEGDSTVPVEAGKEMPKVTEGAADEKTAEVAVSDTNIAEAGASDGGENVPNTTAVENIAQDTGTDDKQHGDVHSSNEAEIIASTSEVSEKETTSEIETETEAVRTVRPCEAPVPESGSLISSPDQNTTEPVPQTKDAEDTPNTKSVEPVEKIATENVAAEPIEEENKSESVTVASEGKSSEEAKGECQNTDMEVEKVVEATALVESNAEANSEIVEESKSAPGAETKDNGTDAKTENIAPIETESIASVDETKQDSSVGKVEIDTLTTETDMETSTTETKDTIKSVENGEAITSTPAVEQEDTSKAATAEIVGPAPVTEAQDVKSDATPTQTDNETLDEAKVPSKHDVEKEETAKASTIETESPAPVEEKQDETQAVKSDATPTTVTVSEAQSGAEDPVKLSDDTAEDADHDYEDVTPLNSVKDEVVAAQGEDTGEVAKVNEDVNKVVEDAPPVATPRMKKYEDVTHVNTVIDDVVATPVKDTAEVTNAVDVPLDSPRNKKDSFVETKDGIVDDIEFIKAKLTTPPIAPAKSKRASKEVKEMEVNEMEVKDVEVKAMEVKKEDVKDQTVKVDAKEVTDKEEVKPKEVIKEEVNSKEDVVLEGPSSNEKKEEFSKECIPPVRPLRSRRAPAKLEVPDWRPPKQSILEYVFGCFRPNIVDQ